MPGPEVPKPEVFRGHDNLFQKTHGERRSVLFPSPQTQARPAVGHRVENPIAPCKAAGRPALWEQLSGCRFSAPLGTWDRRPHHASWNREGGAAFSQPLSHLQAGDRRDSGPDTSFLCTGTNGTAPAFPLGIPQEKGLWACFPVCVLACSCFCHF